MEHIVCQNCKSEYDLKAVVAPGWRLIPHHTVCEVCRSALKDWEKDQENILIMTKRGFGS